LLAVGAVHLLPKAIEAEIESGANVREESAGEMLFRQNISAGECTPDCASVTVATDGTLKKSSHWK
jgi:hypothetical protein